MSIKTVTCDNCGGEGYFHANNQKCMRCNGKGVLTEQRVLKLLNEYFPRRLQQGVITAAAFEHQIAKLKALLEQLGAPYEEPGIAGSGANSGDKLLLTSDVCARNGVTADTTLRELKLKFPAIYVEGF